MTGGVFSITVKLVVQFAELLAASVTVMIIVVTPVETRVPAIGDCVIVKADDAVQLSVAVTLAVKSGTIAWQLALAFAD